MIKKLAILGYHKIGEPPPDGWHTWNYIPAAVFEEQLKYLTVNGWSVINVDTFLEGIKNNKLLPEKAALITFDDGYKSNLEIALPILQKFSYPAIVFVPTSFIGSYNAFDADILFEPKEQICTWGELKQLEDNNISVQSHGVTHRHFSKLSGEAQIAEVITSKNILEKGLNKEVSIFSFPYGDDGIDKKEIKNLLINAGYQAACLYGGSIVNLVNADPFRLERVAIGCDTNIETALKL